MAVGAEVRWGSCPGSGEQAAFPSLLPTLKRVGDSRRLKVNQDCLQKYHRLVLATVFDTIITLLF